MKFNFLLLSVILTAKSKSKGLEETKLRSWCDDSLFFTMLSCCLNWWVAMLLFEIVAWAPSYRRRCSPSVNTWPRRLSPSCLRSPSRCTCRQSKCHSSAPRMFLLTKNWTWLAKTAKRRLQVTHLEYAGTVRCSPCIQQIIFAGRHEPLSAGREAQRQDATLVQVKLVFVGFGGVKHFDVRVLHSNCEPIAWKWNQN